jgi:hypothetical protein
MFQDKPDGTYLKHTQQTILILTSIAKDELEFII